MKILWCGASADWSIVDASNGYRDALIRQGHDVHEFKLARRLVNIGRFLGLDPTVANLAEVSRHASRTVTSDALELQPDWVLICSAMAFHPDAVVLLKRAGFRVGVIFTESPYSDADQEYFANLCDFAATNDRGSAAKYGWLYLPSAYSAEHHHPVDVDAYNAEQAAAYRGERVRWEIDCAERRRTWKPQPCGGCGLPLELPALLPEPEPPLVIPRHDVVLVGTGWIERVNRLKQIDWNGIDFGIYGFWPQLDEDRKEYEFSMAAGLGEDAEGRAVLGRYYTKRPTENAETVALYAGAKIVLNDHRFHPDAYSANPRVYETLAVGGGLLLTDYRPEVADLLGDRWTEFVFTDAADLSAKIRYYLSHEAERRELVTYGQARVQGQTFDARAVALVAGLAEREQDVTDEVVALAR